VLGKEKLVDEEKSAWKRKTRRLVVCLCVLLRRRRSRSGKEAWDKIGKTRFMSFNAVSFFFKPTHNQTRVCECGVFKLELHTKSLMACINVTREKLMENPSVEVSQEIAWA